MTPLFSAQGRLPSMKARTSLVTAFLAAVTLLMPFQASALSVRQYESATKQQRAEAVVNAIERIVADVAKVNPSLSKAIHDYFYVTPQGQPAAPGVTAFEGDLAAIEDLADRGKLDLDKVQIEGILLGVIKRDVMQKQSSKVK